MHRYGGQSNDENKSDALGCVRVLRDALNLPVADGSAAFYVGKMGFAEVERNDVRMRLAENAVVGLYLDSETENVTFVTLPLE